MSSKYTDTQTFCQKTKRFFEPVKYNIGVTLFLFSYFIAQYSFAIIFILFVRDVTLGLEGGNKDIFYETLLQYLYIFIGAFILVFLLSKGWAYSFNRYRSYIEKKYLLTYITFDQNEQEKMGTGKSIAIITKGIRMWATLLDRIFIEGISFVLSVGVTLYLLSQISILLGVLLCILLFFGTIIGIILNNFVIKWRIERNELDNIWSKNVVKIIMAKMEVLQTGKINHEIEKLHKLHEGQIYYNKKIAPYLVPFFVIGSFIITTLLFVVFYYFGNLYLEGKISLGYIASLTGALLMMQTVFLNVLDFLKNFGKEFTEVRNLWHFFDSTPQITGYEEGNTFEYQSGVVELQNISYEYTENTPVFNNFSLSLSGGNITAFVGPSGGGKSTLVKLIAGYLKANSGDIIIDGQKLSDTSLKSYYSSVGYLTQEPSVFDGTVRENLMYGVKNMNDKTGKEETSFDLTNIISLAHCDFIYDLPNGLDTEIGERGLKLSGGQKQRLAIAKIFLKNPQIIILDEPTSALDSLSEKKITEAMHNLFQKRTVLVIAHRLQTVKHADEIIVIDSGKIIERGNHKNLIKQNGYYAEMLELQSGF